MLSESSTSSSESTEKAKEHLSVWERIGILLKEVKSRLADERDQQGTSIDSKDSESDEERTRRISSARTLEELLQVLSERPIFNSIGNDVSSQVLSEIDRIIVQGITDPDQVLRGVITQRMGIREKVLELVSGDTQAVEVFIPPNSHISLERGQPTEASDDFAELPNTLETAAWNQREWQVKSYTTAFGRIAFGTEVGDDERKDQQDMIVTIGERKGGVVAVIDGMGGEGGPYGGSQAAEIFAKVMISQHKRGMKFVQAEASMQMKEEGLGRAGVCYNSLEIDEITNELKIHQAGDVRTVIASINGMINSTVDEGDDQSVHNAVQGTNIGETQISTFDLNSGDRIISASDGLWKCFQDNNEVVNFIKREKNTVKAIEKLRAEVRRRTKADSYFNDNLSIVIYDYKPESLQSVKNIVVGKVDKWISNRFSPGEKTSEITSPEILEQRVKKAKSLSELIETIEKSRSLEGQLNTNVPIDQMIETLQAMNSGDEDQLKKVKGISDFVTTLITSQRGIRLKAVELWMKDPETFISQYKLKFPTLLYIFLENYVSEMEINGYPMRIEAAIELMREKFEKNKINELPQPLKGLLKEVKKASPF